MRLLHYIFPAAIVAWILLSWSFLWNQETPVAIRNDPETSPQMQDVTDSPQLPKEASTTTQFESYTNSFIPAHESFSACIMFKDDTHRLVEWLAYHYHVLPLRQVIIGVDQGSSTFPIELAERYSDRMKVTIWPKDVFAADSDLFVSDRKRKMDGANLFLRRQMFFLRKCALQLQSENRGWTIFTDPDEYLLFNYPAGEMPPPTVQEDLRGIVLPSVRDEGTVYKFLLQQGEKGGSHANSCITVPRLLFGNRISPFPANGVKEVALDTLRYRSHADRRDYKSNRQAKNLLDLRRIRPKQLENLKNVHRMVPELCWSPQLTDDKALFKINHYMGSKASFFHRKDDRDQYGRKDSYDAFASINDGTDDTIASWYDGFVEAQGRQVAIKLLHGAGAV